MSEQRRDETGRYREKTSTQDILKAFDAADAPFLTAGEIADIVGIANSTVNQRLKQMHEVGLVERKETGARSVGWWATVAPRLSEESAARVDRSREEIERGEVVALDDLISEYSGEETKRELLGRLARLEAVVDQHNTRIERVERRVDNQ